MESTSTLAYVIAIAAVVLSAVGVSVSLRTAWIQINLQRQEWRPYLSFKPFTGHIRPYATVNDAVCEFIVQLENVGRVPLCFEVEKFDFRIENFEPLANHKAEWNSPEKFSSKRGAIPVGSSINYIRTLSSSRKAETVELSNTTGITRCRVAAPRCTIDFSIKYYQANNPNKKYTISFTASCSITEEETTKGLHHSQKEYKTIRFGLTGDSVYID